MVKETEFKTREIGASVTINIGKPTKDGMRNVSGEYTVKHFDGESNEEFEKRYNYYKQIVEREL